MPRQPKAIKEPKAKKLSKKQLKENDYLRDLESLPEELRDLYASTNKAFGGSVERFRAWADGPSLAKDNVSAGQYLAGRYGGIVPKASELNRKLRDERQAITELRKNARKEAAALVANCKQTVSEAMLAFQELQALGGQDEQAAGQACEIDFETLPQAQARRSCSIRKQQARAVATGRNALGRARVGQARNACAQSRAQLRGSVNASLSNLLGKIGTFETDKRVISTMRQPRAPF